MLDFAPLSPQPQTLPEPSEDHVRRALAENQLKPGDRGNLLRFYQRTDDGWRNCCGSACDPCVDRLGRAVDQLRALESERSVEG